MGASARTVRTAIPRLAAVIAAASAVIGSPHAVQALSLTDYISYTLTMELSRSVVTAGEVFAATISGRATCKKDLPLAPSEVSVTSRIVARHVGSSQSVVLNAGYTASFGSVPSRAGETVEESVVVPLAFPANSPPGEYVIFGELVDARIRVVAWLDVSGMLPASYGPLGTVTILAPDPPAEAGGPEEPGETPSDLAETPPAAAETDDAPAAAEEVDPPATPDDSDRQAVPEASAAADTPVVPGQDDAIPGSSIRATSLTLSPGRASIGDTVEVTVVVVNQGIAEATTTITLKVDGETVATQEITLAGREAREVRFTVSSGRLGVHEVEVAGLSAVFEVLDEQPEPAPAGQAPAGPSAGSTAPWLILAAGAGVLFGGLAALVLLRRGSRRMS